MVTPNEVRTIAAAVWEHAPVGTPVEAIAAAIRDVLNLPDPKKFPAAFIVTAPRPMKFRVVVQADGTGTVTEIKPFPTSPSTTPTA